MFTIRPSWKFPGLEETFKLQPTTHFWWESFPVINNKEVFRLMRRNSDSSPQCFQSNPGTQDPAALGVSRDAAEDPGVVAQAVGAMVKAGDLTHLPVLLHGLISCLRH